MKALEVILKVLIRIVNIPLFFITVVFSVLLVLILFFVVCPIEAFIVMPIYYLTTGKWYYGNNRGNNFKYPYRNWLPVLHNVGNYMILIPDIFIDEDIIDLNKHYGRDKEH